MSDSMGKTFGGSNAQLLFSDKTPEGISEEQRERRFKFWEWRTIMVCLLGYATFYLVRKNFSIAIPSLQSEEGFSPEQIGLILTLQGVIYGLSKFAHGFVGDRVNARIFMTGALILTALANIAFGVTGMYVNMFAAFAVIWSLNGWIQGMGVAPCNKMIANWIPPSELATKMSIWNTSHSIGAGAAIMICGWWIIKDFGWQACFWIPGVIALGGAVFIWFGLRDTPESVGLPPVKIEGDKKLTDDTRLSNSEYKSFVIEHVFKNKVVWLVTLANFFIYAVRFTFLDWGYDMLQKWLNVSSDAATGIVLGFELTGVVGMIMWGYITDKFFGGNAIRVSVICMGLTALCMLPLLMCNLGFWGIIIFVSLVGLLIYGPQALVGIVAINHATKKAASAAIGLVGISAYTSTLVSGWGIGKLVQVYGWETAMWVVLGLCLIGMLIFAVGWFAPTNAYSSDDKKA